MNKLALSLTLSLTLTLRLCCVGKPSILVKLVKICMLVKVVKPSMIIKVVIVVIFGNFLLKSWPELYFPSPH